MSHPSTINRMDSAISYHEGEEEWHQDERKTTKKSGIDASIATRRSSMTAALVNAGLRGDDDGDDDDDSLIQALIALGEATAFIAVHLQNYVEHTYAGSTNKSGDEQLHLDILCDEEVFKAVKASGVYQVVASEETPEETVVGDGSDACRYSLGCDPLDGSSIIDANFSVGSIFGIWPGHTLVGRTGREQVASAVSLYGPRTLLCIALPKIGKVIELTLVKNRTLWEVSRDTVTIQPSGKVFAPGNLRASNDNPKYANLIQYWTSNRYTLRYTGGMVPDIYHIFAKGKGIFTNVSSDKAKAKLRLLYEVAPIGLIVETAGGSAIDESRDVPVLDITIENTDHRLGLCCGSSEEVSIFKDIMFK